MRLIIDSLVALALLALVGVWFAQQRSGDRALAAESEVRANLAVLEERTAFHAALRWKALLDAGERPMTKFPVAVEPAWFGGAMPGNVVASSLAGGSGELGEVGGARAWLDVAPTDDFSEHPPDPVLVRSGQAGVWYNPNTGVFRARTPMEAGDALTLARYNRLNGTSLTALPKDNDPERMPLAYVPGKVPGSALAHGGSGGSGGAWGSEADGVDVLFASPGYGPWNQSLVREGDALGVEVSPDGVEALPERRVRPSLLTR